MKGGRDLHLVGLSHKSAPVAVREKVALTTDDLKAALSSLVARSGVGEAMVVSTCNRVECYVYGESLDEARHFFLSRTIEAEGHLYAHSGPEAVRHLFRVAASLDSMVVGEPQILGQVKEAYGLAASVQTAGTFVSRLCNKAFATAKRVRNETEIARGAGSVSQVAVELVEKIFGDLKGRSVLLVGAGKMGALSAKALRDLGADRILVTNRSPERARSLARDIGATAEPWEGLTSLLAVADVVIVSTGAPTYVITRELAGQVMKARRGRSICFIDLAVPRNVDPACGQMDNVYAYDIDDLQKVVHQTHAARAEEAIRAEAIVEAEVMAFAREREARAALPVLAELRRKAEQIARTEAERTLAHLGEKLDEKGRRSVEAMAQAIVNKLLHGPTARLKEAAASGDSDLPGAAAALFGVEGQEPPRPRTPPTSPADAAAPTEPLR
ncbi:MAG: glutamyl-tRNA reductase [Deltaproteobacteria bacterium]